MVTKTEIDDCHHLVPGTGKLQPLTTTQERAFDKLADRASLSVEDLDLRTPYLIGGLTSFQFVKMSEFTDYMLSIDPDGEKVKWNTQGSRSKTFSHYHDKWDRVLTSAALHDVSTAQHFYKTRQTGTSAAAVSKAREQTKEPKRGVLYPYTAYFDRKAGKAFSEYDTVWSYATLIKPGTSSYFLVYRYEPGRTMKA